MTPEERAKAEDLYNLVYAHTVIKYNPEAGIRCCADALRKAAAPTNQRDPA